MSKHWQIIHQIYFTRLIEPDDTINWTRWQSPWAIQVFVVVFVWCLSSEGKFMSFGEIKKRRIITGREIASKCFTNLFPFDWFASKFSLASVKQLCALSSPKQVLLRSRQTTRITAGAVRIILHTTMTCFIYNFGNFTEHTFRLIQTVFRSWERWR